jgi:hypothetical protein
MNRWFRFYDDAINDPKILKLSDKTYRIWVGILCLASKNDGVLPPFEDVALLLRMKPEKLQPELEKLITAGLLDHDDDGISPHNWRKRQFKSDVSTERVKRFRNAGKTVSETPPDTDTDTDTDTDNKIGAKAPDGGGYAFEGDIIKLRKRTFDDWVKAYPNLDLRAELTARDAWLGSPKAKPSDRENWFPSTSQHLANRNRDARVKLTVAREDAGGPFQKTSIPGVA